MGNALLLMGNALLMQIPVISLKGLAQATVKAQLHFVPTRQCFLQHICKVGWLFIAQAQQSAIHELFIVTLQLLQTASGRLRHKNAARKKMFSSTAIEEYSNIYAISAKFI